MTPSGGDFMFFTWPEELKELNCLTILEERDILRFCLSDIADLTVTTQLLVSATELIASWRTSTMSPAQSPQCFIFTTPLPPLSCFVPLYQ